MTDHSTPPIQTDRVLDSKQRTLVVEMLWDTVSWRRQ